MSYRPITDLWLLARPKVAYYGAYPNGFLERARAFMPVVGGRCQQVLHVCGGMAKQYPTWGKLCPFDLTCDANPDLDPDLVWDVAKQGIPRPIEFSAFHNGGSTSLQALWPGILIDPPYTETDAKQYAMFGEVDLPSPRRLIKQAKDVLTVGGRVGLLHYKCPRPPVGMKFVACVGVLTGFDGSIRCFSVFERTE